MHTFHGHGFTRIGRFKTRTYLGIERLLAPSPLALLLSPRGKLRSLQMFTGSPHVKYSSYAQWFEWSASPGSRAEVQSGVESQARPDRGSWMGRLVPIKGIELLADVVKQAA